MRYLACVSVLSATLLVGGVLAQSNIDPNHKFSWCESLGWSDWRGDGVASGAVVHGTILSGAVWLENAGWIILGDGSPVDGVHYGNVDASDFGVNIDADGNLYGLAWGENIGWVNFDTSSAGPSRVRLQYCNRFQGYAWGENIGWINFDDALSFVGLDTTVLAPTGSPSMTMGSSSGSTLLSWSPLENATGYDAVRGDLTSLQTSSGDFTAATTNCLGNNLIGTNSLLDPTAPAPGQGHWFLVRGVNCGGSGTYDGPPPQVGQRDAEISASAFACP